MENLLEVSSPDAYLLPKSDLMLMDFIEKHSITYSEYLPELIKIEQYKITEIDSLILEDIKLADVQSTIQQISIKDLEGEYIVIPLNQLKRNVIVLAFEPQSMVGLIHYDRFRYLIDSQEYTVLRAYKD